MRRAFCFWPDELQGGVGFREANDLHVHQPGLLAGIEHMLFLDLLPTFWIDNPKCTCAAEWLRQSIRASEVRIALRSEENQVRFL
jgi:hypothetical protein